MTRRIALGVAAAVAGIGTVAAQPRPAFAVTSVKPAASDERGINIQFLRSGRLVISGFPLQMVVAIAYHLPFQSSRLSGGPDWVRSSRYDIEATAEPGAIPAGLSAVAREQKMRLMLQSLLADRFKLAMRTETREMAVFALVVAKDGPKLEKARIEERDCPDTPGSDGINCHQFSGGQGRGMHGQAVDLEDLARYVENWTERPVVNNTGIHGLYHIDTSPWRSLRLGPAPAAGAKGEAGGYIADLPDIFTVFARMGLKLEAQKAPVEIFEITHIEKPSGN